MKTFFITLLLLIASISLITMLDLIMGTNFNQALPNLRKPFEVSDPAEYLVSFVLFALLFLRPIITYIVKKKIKSSSNKN